MHQESEMASRKSSGSAKPLLKLISRERERKREREGEERKGGACHNNKPGLGQRVTKGSKVYRWGGREEGQGGTCHNDKPGLGKWEGVNGEVERRNVVRSGGACHNDKPGQRGKSE